MAKILLATLLVLAAGRGLPGLIRLRKLGGLRDGLLDIGGHSRSTALLLVLPALIVLMTLAIDSGLHAAGHGLLQFSFMLAVLFLCWGPRDVAADIEAVSKAPDSERRLAAAQALRCDVASQPLPFTPAALVGATFNAALARHFGVLFWFALIGPAGAVGYRLVQLLAAAPEQADVSADTRASLSRLRTLVDWVPARLMALSLALVADFEQVMQRWHAYRQLHAQGWFVLDNGFLGSVACAGVDAGLVAELNQPQGSASPLAALIASRLQLQRMLKLWLGVIALVVLGGWAG